MKPTDARTGYDWLTRLHATGRMRVRSSSPRLTCVRRPKCLPLKDAIWRIHCPSVFRRPVTGFASDSAGITNALSGRPAWSSPKETLVLQDGRRLAPVGFAGASTFLRYSGPQHVSLGLIDHIDILKDGASAIYGSDAVGGVFNVWLIHRFRGLEIYASYGNTNLGASNDQGEERAYLLAGTGDDKTDIVVYAEVYNRAAIYNRDRDISSNADFTRFGGLIFGRTTLPGVSETSFTSHSLNGGARSPTPHAFPDVANDPQYVPLSSLPRAQQLFNFAALTPAMAPVDREYLYGSLDHKICDQYLELFADFKYVRGFWDGAWAPTPFTPDVFTDATHPFGISPGRH
jgi:outer membrane receptor protein involved in Fe transport